MPKVKKTYTTRYISLAPKKPKRIRKAKRIASAVSFPNRMINKMFPKIYRFRRSLVAQSTCNSVTSSQNFTSNIPFFVQPANSLESNIVSQLMVFKLSDVPNVTDFSGLFQAYRIRKVNLYVRAVDIGTNAATMPCLYMYKNNKQTETAAGVGAASVDQVANCKRFQFTTDKRIAKITIRPYLWIDTLLTGNTASFSSQSYGDWIDLNNKEAMYYSIALVWTNVAGTSGSAGPINMIFDAEYEMEFKTVV